MPGEPCACAREARRWRRQYALDNYRQSEVLILTSVTLALWVLLLLTPWQPWRCRERIEPDTEPAFSDDFTVLIPARNEANVIGTTLSALAVAAPNAPVILIDDESEDGTAEAARAADHPRLTVIRGTKPPDGWAGKLWALEQGVSHASTPYLLLLDADIRLAPGMITSLQEEATSEFALISVLAEPCFEGFAARWLLPAFVYFFKLIYPFALANSPRSRVAAAAGGIVLLQRSALEEAGSFAAWREAIIDDCTLAARVKSAGHRIKIGMTRGAQSLRRQGPASIASMVARSAYVQLRESPVLLIAVTLLMAVAFWVPLAAIAWEGPARWLGFAAWVTMAVSYLPTLVYYRRNPLPAVLLPLTATVYIMLTWHSAIRAHLGVRSAWKGRRYSRAAR